MVVPLLLCGIGVLFAMCASCFYRMGVADWADEKKFLIDSLESLASENARLRDSLKALMIGTNAELCANRDEPDCKDCSMHHGKDGCTVVDAMELLGIDMFGEPLGVKS